MTAKIKPTKPHRPVKAWFNPILIIADEHHVEGDLPCVIVPTDPASVESMVEKMAKALYVDTNGHMEWGSWDSCNEECKEACHESARAALTALHPNLKRK